MDIYDPGLMAGGGRADGSSTLTSNDQNNKTELDQNVEKLVGNISNWWTGFAKKSQDSITQARKEMENRGGIVNYAKSEYAKLESSIGEAQKKARDQSQQQSQEANQESSADSATVPAASEDAANRSGNSKGKQRAIDDPAAAPDSATALNQGPTLGASVLSLFTKLTSDPRLVQLQHSLTSTLQSVSSPAGIKEPKDGDATETATGATPINIQESLSKLSLTIQSHLPHLDLKESQQLATRYLHATESFAREMQSDMKDFVGELVRIVPPEGEARETHSPTTVGSDSVAKAGVADKTAADSQPEKLGKTSADTTEQVQKQAATASAEEEEDFAWDEDDEEAAAASTEAAPPATSATEKAKAADQASSTAVPAASENKAAASKAEESEEDSDWE
ncbi:uncharacterized protein SPSC_03475 [Sporisorium scitamineum]|uniref:BSD domain-containing protein n=1 Tax=Sporisorium scitamineum TaxID=49012 RepID=A0A0F7S3N4_9BASI|nr:uncharacterized protein SPSC_03475 [Sporisorium scitamineum]CDS01849.1 hypothetical protein [Sporisorium scitamineum]